MYYDPYYILLLATYLFLQSRNLRVTFDYVFLLCTQQSPRIIPLYQIVHGFPKPILPFYCHSLNSNIFIPGLLQDPTIYQRTSKDLKIELVSSCHLTAVFKTLS